METFWGAIGAVASVGAVVVSGLFGWQSWKARQRPKPIFTTDTILKAPNGPAGLRKYRLRVAHTEEAFRIKAITQPWWQFGHTLALESGIGQAWKASRKIECDKGFSKNGQPADGDKWGQPYPFYFYTGGRRDKGRTRLHIKFCWVDKPTKVHKAKLKVPAKR